MSLESTDGLVEMLSTVGDGHGDLAHALSFVSLNVEQGMRMYTTLRMVRLTTQKTHPSVTAEVLQLSTNTCGGFQSICSALLAPTGFSTLETAMS